MRVTRSRHRFFRSSCHHRSAVWTKEGLHRRSVACAKPAGLVQGRGAQGLPEHRRLPEDGRAHAMNA
ncbi:hypothetical protein [Polaromonas sp. CG9_12]|nr:hypothetical protein [Polaromonas sp. CG9_12]